MSNAGTSATVDRPGTGAVAAVDRVVVYRAGLVAAAARHMGLAPDDLAVLAQAIAGCRWERCGLAELRLVAWTLVEASRRSVGQAGCRDGACED
jgi:hypothetical protein